MIYSIAVWHVGNIEIVCPVNGIQQNVRENVYYFHVCQIFEVTHTHIFKPLTTLDFPFADRYPV